METLPQAWAIARTAVDWHVKCQLCRSPLSCAQRVGVRLIDWQGVVEGGPNTAVICECW